ncbi:hypothetical protein pclt_cds_640 [Pandoravirus celtis]|uniref:Ubiquitin domain containing protein n=1 Tax=Pandoravirus celtis TaxID=2568002 RepID=A0A4D6EIH8_9VIRU|nr:hypothetical protein pclt_cds_640 [Pandoravirus celtis]
MTDKVVRCDNGDESIGNTESVAQANRPPPIAFLRKGQRHVIAFVDSFDFTEFRLTLYGASDPPETVAIHLNRDQDAAERWESAPLPQCCICIDHRADRFLGCACTAPCVCGECATVIRKCPQCRQRVQGRADCEGLLATRKTKRVPTDHEWIRRMTSRFPWIHDIILPYGESGGMQLFLRAMDQRSFTLHVAPRWPVTMLKNVVYYKTDVTPREQRLVVSGGPQLDGEWTLEDWGVQKESLVQLVMRLRGD